ncbi:glycosyltransferase [Leptolyngbya sp. GB1-A1]|uniref:glycosyltransferase n=1 Tax=Leptolyngbya sp. GB1-A1 TaxID=2933908 RepID=UPI00329A711B
MKILLVIPAVGSIYGGPTKIVLELAQALGSNGVSVDIVTTNANGSTNLDVPLHTWVAEGLYRIQYFPHWGWGDYKISLSLASWLFRHIGDYDLAHTNALFSYPILLTHWACQFRRVPYIATPHGMLESWALSYKARKKHLYYSLFEKAALQKAESVQITGSPEALSIKSLGISTPIFFAPNGIDRQEFETLPDPEIFYREFPDTRYKTLILFLGRIDPKKGLDLLSAAFAQIHKQFPETHLILAGPDNTGYLSTARSYFAEVGCLEAVTFTGMLTGSLKLAALAAVNLYVAPSYSEGFSMSVLEGMASGLPCVITTGCNFPEAAQAQAAQVVKIDAHAIASALIHCLQNPEEAKAMGDRARQFIFENYTWDSIAANLIQVYQTIINSSSQAIKSAH